MLKVPRDKTGFIIHALPFLQCCLEERIKQDEDTLKMEYVVFVLHKLLERKKCLKEDMASGYSLHPFSLFVSTISQHIKHDTQGSIGLDDPEEVPKCVYSLSLFFLALNYHFKES